MESKDLKHKVIIVEPNLIICEGIRVVVNSMAKFEVVDVITDFVASANKLNIVDADIVIINPDVIDYSKRALLKSYLSSFENKIFIALLSDIQDVSLTKHFASHIYICDDRETIESKLTSCVDNKNVVSDTDLSDLSDREKEILISVVNGLTNKEVADKHNISIHTVISHRKNISRKTGIKSVSGLTIYALINGLVEHNF